MLLSHLNALVPLAAALAIAALIGLLLVRRRRRLMRDRRQRRVLDELDDLGVIDVEVFQPTDGDTPLRRLGKATVVRGKSGLVRRQRTLLAEAHDVSDWPTSPNVPLLLRFQIRGIRWQLPCRTAGWVKLTARMRQRVGVKSKRVFRLAPTGLLVKREKRDMRRYYVGDEETKAPTGFTDARRYVHMQAWLWTTTLTEGRNGYNVRLRPEAFEVIRSEPDADAVDQDSTPGTKGWTGHGEAGLAVDVVDFSGGGFLVEGDPSTLATLIPLAEEDAFKSDDADHVLQVAVSVWLDFPPKVSDLAPQMPETIWYLAVISRITVIEPDDEDEGSIQLGLDLLYQSLEKDRTTGSPSRWGLISGDAEHLVTLHNSLSRAAAQLQADPG